LPGLIDLPTLFFWGTKDAFYKEGDLARLQTLFPNNTTHILEGAGHFIQSEAGPEIASAIREWLPEVQ
jgi:haloalkane dehalogenase